MGDIRTPDQRLRVFVSSTLGELADERRAARAAVERLRLIPVMFELGARPHPPRALYSSYLEQSDVFIGVYWQRYGWVAPDMDVSGLEHEMLLSHGMPRLLYLKQPAPDIEPELARMLADMEAEGSTSYKPFETPQQLEDLILDDLAILLTERFETSVASRDDAVTRPRHNLPAQTSTFIGREHLRRDLHSLIADDEVRLITLRGPAGTGKTRLAIRVAHEAVDRFADGVQFADISSEREADAAFAHIARVLGVAVAAGTRPHDALVEDLRDRELLVVFDNFEQVTSAAVGVVELLERCPRLKVLVTSREALRVRGERDFPVAPLSLPDDEGAEAAEASEAVQLFCDRARGVRPDFRLADANAGAIAAICRRLDGLPLAIELASARIQLLDVDDLRSRLDDRVDILRGGPRDLPKRQQTLRDAIDWSYDLLDDDEQVMLRALGAFSGGRLTDVEETVARVPSLGGLDVLGVLASLVSKSLVRSTHGSDGAPRLMMLRTLQAYAAQRLDEDVELAGAVRQAHAEQFTAVAEHLEQRLTAQGRGSVLHSLADELENMRSAWDLWFARADVPQLNRLLAPLWGFYDARGDYRSAFELGDQVLDRLAATPDSPERRRDEFALRMSVLRTDLAVRGYTSEAEQLIVDALAEADLAGDTQRRFADLRSLAYLHLMRSEFARVGEIADELMAMAEADDDPLLRSDAHLLTGFGRSWLTGLGSSLPHYDKAIEYAARTPTGHIDFRVGTHPGVVANVVSALTHWMAGSPVTATATMRHALELAADLDHPYSVAYATHHAALLDMWAEDVEGLAARAATLDGLAGAHDYPVWRALALVLGGLADVRSGRVDDGLARGNEGFELYKGLSAPPVFWPALLMIRALTLASAGRTQEARDTIETAVEALRDGDPMAPDIHMVHGDLLLEVDDLVGAEAALDRAAALASERGCRMAQLQALTRLVCLRRGTPSEDEARDALRGVYAGLTEGHDLPPLLGARAVLDEVS